MRTMPTMLRCVAAPALLLLLTLLLFSVASSPALASTPDDSCSRANRTSSSAPQLSADNSIFDNIRAIPSLSFLAKGLTYPQHTHLRHLLSSCRGVNYTVFAPSNWAVLHAIREFNRTLVRSGYPTVDEIKRDLMRRGVLNASTGAVSESDSLARPEDQQLNAHTADAAFAAAAAAAAFRLELDDDFGAVALFANPEEIRQHCSLHSADGVDYMYAAGPDEPGESDAEKEQTRHDKIPKGFNITNLVLRYSKSAALYHVVVGSFPIESLPAHAFLPTLLRNDSALVALNGEPQRMHVENITAARLELQKSTPTLAKPFPVPALNYSTAVDMDSWMASSAGGGYSAGAHEDAAAGLDVLETHSLARSNVEAAARLQQSRLLARLQRWYAFEQQASGNASGNLDARITPIKVLFGTAYDPISQSTYDRLMQNATWPSLGVERYIASVVVPDIPCANGLIHIIDRVLEVPMNASLQLQRANLSSVADVLNKTNLTEQVHSMQNITLLVPSNEAVQTFVKGLGKNVSLVSDAVEFATASNGWARLLHVLNALAADSQPIQQLPAANPQQQDGEQGGSGGSGNATLTVDDIKKILLHHIVQGAYRLPEVPMNASLMTLTGGSLQLMLVNGSTAMVNNASITKQSILIRNGVMHEIDQVLVPEGIPGVSPPAGGGGAGGGDSGKTQTTSKFTLLSVTDEETGVAAPATTTTTTTLASPSPAQGGVTVGLVQLPAGSAAPVYTAELKFSNLSVSVIPASNSAAINATTLGCLASDLVCLAVDKTALECVTQLNLMSESEKQQCEKRAFRYTAMTDPATSQGAAGNWGGDPLLNLPRTPTCFSPHTHTCVNGNFLCPLTHPFLCGAQCYSKAEYVCYSSFSMCPQNASSKCGFACYNEKQYSCERGKLVSKGGGGRPRPVGASEPPVASTDAGAGAAMTSTGEAGAGAPQPATSTPPQPATADSFYRNFLRTGPRWRN